MSDHYDRSGEPISWDRYIELLKDPAYKRVDRTEIDGVVVSTVWLGLDHGWANALAIFETMVFGGPLDRECDRYSCERFARSGHERMVARVKAAAAETIEDAERYAAPV